jgi:hypothetical protein
MAILPTPTNPTIQVDFLTGSDMANVTLTVNLGFVPLDFQFIEVEGSVWGLDGGFNGGDDSLLLFPKQTFLPPTLPADFNSPVIVTFSGVVPRAWLDEDNGSDEIYSRFDIVGRPNNSVNNITGVITSPVLRGEFGID